MEHFVSNWYGIIIRDCFYFFLKGFSFTNKYFEIKICITYHNKMMIKTYGAKKKKNNIVGRRHNYGLFLNQFEKSG